MSERLYTTSAEVDIELHEGELTVRFCDANVAQWAWPLGRFSDYDDDQLAEAIADMIRDEADDLAESLVAGLRRRTAHEPTEREST